MRFITPNCVRSPVWPAGATHFGTTSGFPTILELPASGAPKEQCDTLFRDTTSVRRMTRADLIEEVSRAAEVPRKEADIMIIAIFNSIVRALRSGDKVEIRGFGS